MDEIIMMARTVLATTPERWTSLARELPEALVRRPPAPGEWSALECLQHLVDAEQHVFPVRVQYLLAEQDFPAYDPDSQGSKTDTLGSVLELAERFDRLRAVSLAALDQLAPADLGKTARHAELGPVTLSELLHEWAAHDLMHTVQAERALMQPFIHGSGPWQVYFTAHLAAPGD